MMISRKLTGVIEVAVHVLTWTYIFLSPLFFKRSDESIHWERLLEGSVFPAVTCVMFYVNYLCLIPRYVFKPHRLRMFVLMNVLLCLVCMAFVELHMHFVLMMKSTGHPPVGEVRRAFPPRIFFVIRGFLTFVFVIGVSVALRLSKRWHQSERERAEVELKNLKNQVNPHFLLNTLNNIYALTAFDTDKAQEAIQELSRLLRYMLYENQSDRVSLPHEVDFLRSYVALMRIRLSANVQVDVSFEVEDPSVQVAPLLFISLVENAFKHGVSPIQPSYVHVKLHSDSKRLTFDCRNSNFPKSTGDKQPGGIGLVQVARRLELAYAGRYEWRKGVCAEGKEYESCITIYL